MSNNFLNSLKHQVARAGGADAHEAGERFQSARFHPDCGGNPRDARVVRGVDAAAAGRPKVVWLHFASDTGCTESFIKSDHPSAGELVLDILSVDYHESIMAAAGKQADEVLAKAVAG
ncbi:MAG: hydrogenase (NiFe) small subunit HydA, partial [Deltaproteobacteria bacterium]|nr:hydrogenase (NiFe) small subunit HydA [Deltaproteobacteria bacterium]